MAAGGWETLRRSAFDADAVSLAHLAVAAAVAATAYAGLLVALGGNRKYGYRPLGAKAEPWAGRRAVPLPSEAEGVEAGRARWLAAQLEALADGEGEQLPGRMRAFVGVLDRLLRLPTLFPPLFFRLPQQTTLQVGSQAGSVETGGREWWGAGGDDGRR